jgi:O-antigen/teichoic acid export membrane protein
MIFFNLRVDLVVLSHYYPNYIIGNYGVAQNIIIYIIGFVFLLTTSFIPKIVKTYELRGVFNIKPLMIAALSVIVLGNLIIQIFGQDVISVLLGGKYDSAFKYLKILMWIIPFQYIMNLYATLNILKNKYGGILVQYLFMAIATIALLNLCGNKINIQYIPFVILAVNIVSGLLSFINMIKSKDICII